MRRERNDTCSKAEDADTHQRDPTDIAPSELEEYHLAKQIKLPSQVPASAGGLNKTSKKASPSQPRYAFRDCIKRGPSISARHDR